MPVIVDAAMALAGAGGLPAVSMAGIGEALGCTSMALYRHVAGKDEVLVLLADRVAADVPALPDDLDWRAGLERWTQVQIEGILAHPWLLDLPLAALPLGPHRARWIDVGLGLMRDLTLPIAVKGQIIGLLSNHVLAEARIELETRGSTTNPFAELGRSLDQLATREDLPHLFAAFTEPADESTGDVAETLGIEMILDGIEARLGRDSATPTRRG